MWLTQKLSELKTEAATSTGFVLSQNEHYTVVADENFKQPKTATPYGLYSKPPTGTPVFLQNGAVIGSLEQSPISIEAGEICLYSASGAFIHLKNNGDVVINNQVFTSAGG